MLTELLSQLAVREEGEPKQSRCFQRRFAPHDQWQVQSLSSQQSPELLKETQSNVKLQKPQLICSQGHQGKVSVLGVPLKGLPLDLCPCGLSKIAYSIYHFKLFSNIPNSGDLQSGGLLEENAPSFTRNPRPQENSPHRGNLTEPSAFFFHLKYMLSSAACMSVSLEVDEG